MTSPSPAAGPGPGLVPVPSPGGGAQRLVARPTPPPAALPLPRHTCRGAARRRAGRAARGAASSRGCLREGCRPRRGGNCPGAAAVLPPGLRRLSGCGRCGAAAAGVAEIWQRLTGGARRGLSRSPLLRLPGLCVPCKGGGRDELPRGAGGRPGHGALPSRQSFLRRSAPSALAPPARRGERAAGSGPGGGRGAAGRPSREPVPPACHGVRLKGTAAARGRCAWAESRPPAAVMGKDG